MGAKCLLGIVQHRFCDFPAEAAGPESNHEEIIANPNYSTKFLADNFQKGKGQKAK